MSDSTYFSINGPFTECFQRTSRDVVTCSLVIDFFEDLTSSETNFLVRITQELLQDFYSSEENVSHRKTRDNDG